MLGLLTLGAALAATVPVPFEDGRHVYTHPEDWRPKGISAQGLEELQERAETLRTPFYVVLIDGAALPGAGEGMVRLQEATDELMAAWGGEGTGFDLSRYTVFTVAWGADCDKPPARRAPGTVCKFFLNTGSEFIHGPAQFLPSRDHERYTRLFLNQVKTTPQDPQRGIEDVMRQVDQMLWDRTDPEKVLARAQKRLTAANNDLEQGLERAEELGLDTAEAEALLATGELALSRAEPDDLHATAELVARGEQELLREVRTLERHQSDLEDALGQLGNVLAHGEKLDASGLAEARAIYDRAQPVASSTDLEALVETHREVTDARTSLGEVVQLAVEARVRAEQAKVLRTVTACAAVVLLLFLIGFLRIHVVRRRAFYAVNRDDRREKLANAAARYVDLELHDREALAVLEDAGGRTAEERASLQQELDDIYAGIKALEHHLGVCDGIAQGGLSLSTRKLDQADAALDAPFDYDTGQLNDDELFAGETRVIQVVPADFMAELADRFKAVKARHDRLREAADKRFVVSAELFPHAGIDGLFERVAAADVPEGWLDDHPLFGDDASDATFYGRLDAVRTEDPLSWLGRLDELEGQEAVIGDRVTTLEESLERVTAVRLSRSPDVPSCVLLADDDPRVAFSRAAMADAELRGVVVAGQGDKDTDAVVRRAMVAEELYKRVQAQAETLKAAVAGLAELQRQVHSEADAANKALKAARARADAATAEHAKAEGAQDHVRAGFAELHSGERHVATAARLTHDQRLLEAHRAIQQALAAFQLAREMADEAQAQVDRLDADKVRFAALVAESEAVMAKAVGDVQRYGGSVVFEPWTPPVAEGIVDYAVLAGMVERRHRTWRTAAREARWEHEEAERRRRAAAAEAVAAAASLRRSSSSSSRSSWSSSSSFGSSSFGSSSSSSFSSGGGSSFGGGGSSGGGGSFGGGRSSGGGGGW